MKRLLTILLALMLCVPAVMAEDSVYYIDGGTADRVHLRQEASAESASLGLYFSGTSVIVIDWYGEWAWVMIGDVSGHMMTKYLTQEQPAEAGPWQVVKKPGSTWVNLRMSPSMDGLVVMCPDNGTLVRILGETADGWSYVDCEGVKGYIVTDLLTPEAESAQQKEQATFLANDGMGSYRYIFQYSAPNGQNLYFTASMKTPAISFEDVNFDGWDDIVVMIASGASNAWYTFFVYDAENDEYYRVDCEHSDCGLANYQLYPELGIVASHCNNGCAGALHERILFAWEDGGLKHLRSAVSVNLEEYSSGDGGYTVTTWHDLLHITVRNHELGDYDSSVVWEETISLEDTEYRDIFAEEMEALWQGLK